MSKIWLHEDEYWPWYGFYREVPDYADAAVEVPDQLWQDYMAADRTYWTIKRQILEMAGVYAPAD